MATRGNKNKLGEVFSLFIGAQVIAFFVTALVLLPFAFIVMLALGVGHHIAAGCPAVGYLGTWLLLWALIIVAAAIREGASVKFNTDS